jgi:cytochrome oxidase assembly protein ShyY1
MHRLLRPGWIVTHLAVVAIAVLFTNLGLWQLERHAETRVENVVIEAQQQADPAPVADALAGPDLFLVPVTVTGRYVQGADVRLSPRNRNQLPGYEILTPMQTVDGDVLMVNRGWMPLDEPLPAAPQGEVSLTGRLQPSAAAQQVLPVGGPEIELVSNPDLDVLAAQVPGLVTAAIVEVVDEEARNTGVLPRPAEPVPLDAGNHFSYAMQWFAFTVIGLIGYPLLLRRRIDDERRAVQPDRDTSSARTPADDADRPRSEPVSQ